MLNWFDCTIDGANIFPGTYRLRQMLLCSMPCPVPPQPTSAMHCGGTITSNPSRRRRQGKLQLDFNTRCIAFPPHMILTPSFTWQTDAQPFKLYCGTIRVSYVYWCSLRIQFSFVSYSLPGVKKPLGQYGPAGVEDTTKAAPAAADDDDDDDIDLFGSDDEEVRHLWVLVEVLQVVRWWLMKPSFGWCYDVSLLFLKTTMWLKHSVIYYLCTPEPRCVLLQDEETTRLKEERLAAYNAKKAKSMLLLI